MNRTAQQIFGTEIGNALEAIAAEAEARGTTMNALAETIFASLEAVDDPWDEAKLKAWIAAAPHGDLALRRMEYPL